MELTEEDDKRNHYNYKCDLWSLGILIYEILFKETPYKGNTSVTLLKNIKRTKKGSLRKTEINQLDDLINNLLEKDLNKRLTWD